jgi:hypothetical protein
MSKPKTVQIPLSSGFVVNIRPLPPYYADFIDDALPLVPLPKRKLTMVAETVEVEYIEPESFPTETSEQELYLLYKTAQDKNKEIEKLREKQKMKFLLLNCLDILDGPFKIEDPKWVSRLESALPNFHVPADPSERMVIFIKSQVITTQPELDEIINASLFPEVDMQGIINALSHFQNIVQGSKFTGNNGKKTG